MMARGRRRQRTSACPLAASAPRSTGRRRWLAGSNSSVATISSPTRRTCWRAAVAARMRIPLATALCLFNHDDSVAIGGQGVAGIDGMGLFRLAQFQRTGFAGADGFGGADGIAIHRGAMVMRRREARTDGSGGDAPARRGEWNQFARERCCPTDGRQRRPEPLSRRAKREVLAEDFALLRSLPSCLLFHRSNTTSTSLPTGRPLASRSSITRPSAPASVAIRLDLPKIGRANQTPSSSCSPIAPARYPSARSPTRCHPSAARGACLEWPPPPPSWRAISGSSVSRATSSADTGLPGKPSAGTPSQSARIVGFARLDGQAVLQDTRRAQFADDLARQIACRDGAACRKHEDVGFGEGLSCARRVFRLRIGRDAEQARLSSRLCDQGR